MTIRICASSLIVVGAVTAPGPAVAQQPYPDLKGTWIGPGVTLAVGKTERRQPEYTGLRFREDSWTIVIDRQVGIGSQARGGERRARGAIRSSA
jgi:hypothetical protein